LTADIENDDFGSLDGLNGAKMNEQIKTKLELLPASPGCYLMKDKNEEIIYVGKAKLLKNRVRSYFRGSHNTKTERLISEIEDMEIIVTESNIEALLLEINLIKKNRPKYNIMLRDDKSYPFIKVTSEAYPRLLITRKVLEDNAHYFGPFPDVGAANETKKILDKLYPLRKCKILPKEVCLYYHIKQCLAPCVFQIEKECFAKMVEKINKFLNGGEKPVLKELKQKMQTASSKLDFEKAVELRDQIKSIETVMIKQKMTNSDLKDRDVFGYAFEQGWMCVQVFFVRQGKLIERDVSIFPFYSEASEDFLTYLGQFYEKKEHFVPKEILLPEDIDEVSVAALVATKIIKPKQGDKKKLVGLATKNAQLSLQQNFDLLARKEERTIGAIERLGATLNIPTPVRIEAFDNSNISGTNPVAGMVCFIDGKPAKKEYRKYKIKTVTGSDDYASMREVIFRRYSRILREGLPFPDLILVDGGKGQVDAAFEVLDNQLGLDVPIIGLAKNVKHQTNELFFGRDLKLVPLAHNSQEFFLLERIQNEVHRFAITFHRQLRTKNSFSSLLDGIQGLGLVRKKALMKHFKSLKNIKNASLTELKQVGLPEKVAQDLKKRLSKST